MRRQYWWQLDEEEGSCIGLLVSMLEPPLHLEGFGGGAAGAPLRRLAVMPHPFFFVNKLILLIKVISSRNSQACSWFGMSLWTPIETNVEKAQK